MLAWEGSIRRGEGRTIKKSALRPEKKRGKKRGRELVVTCSPGLADVRVRWNCSIIQPGLLQPAAADWGPLVVHRRLGDALHVGRAALLSLGNGQVVRAPIGSVTGGGGWLWEGRREAVALRACEGTQSHGRKRVARKTRDLLAPRLCDRAQETHATLSLSRRFRPGHYAAFTEVAIAHKAKKDLVALQRFAFRFLALFSISVMSTSGIRLGLTLCGPPMIQYRRANFDVKKFYVVE